MGRPNERTSNLVDLRTGEVQATNLERVGSLVPDKPIDELARRRRLTVVGSSRERSWAEGT
jgi:hypothetical protein